MLSPYHKQIQIRIHTHSPMHTHKHTFSVTPALKDFWFDKFPKLRIFTPILSPKKNIKNWLIKLSPLNNNFLPRSYRNNETESEKNALRKERKTNWDNENADHSNDISFCPFPLYRTYVASRNWNISTIIENSCQLLKILTAAEITSWLFVQTKQLKCVSYSHFFYELEFQLFELFLRFHSN